MMIDEHLIKIGKFEYHVTLRQGCLRFLEPLFPNDVTDVVLQGHVMDYYPLADHEDELRLLIWLHTRPCPMRLYVRREGGEN